MATRSTRIKNAKVDPATRIAREIDMPASQVEHGNLAVVAKGQYNSDGTRDSIRGGSQTVRRLTRIERLVKLGIIDKDQAIACQWYADCHELGFVAQLGVTANYGATGGGGGQAPDHFAKNEAQRQARLNFAFARDGVPPELRDLFDMVVLGNMGENEFRAVTRNEVLRIGIAAWRLHGQVSHLIAVAA